MPPLFVSQEVKEILCYAVSWNSVRKDVHTRLQAFDAWRQVVEVILSGCTEEAVGDQRVTVIIDILNSLIKKVVKSYITIFHTHTLL